MNDLFDFSEFNGSPSLTLRDKQTLLKMEAKFLFAMARGSKKSSKKKVNVDEIYVGFHRGIINNCFMQEVMILFEEESLPFVGGKERKLSKKDIEDLEYENGMRDMFNYQALFYKQLGITCLRLSNDIKNNPGDNLEKSALDKIDEYMKLSVLYKDLLKEYHSNPYEWLKKYGYKISEYKPKINERNST